MVLVRALLGVATVCFIMASNAAPAGALPPPGGTSCDEPMMIPLPPSGVAGMAGALAEGETRYYGFELPADTKVAVTVASVAGWFEARVYDPDCRLWLGIGLGGSNAMGVLPAFGTGATGGVWILGVQVVDAGPAVVGAYTATFVPCPFDAANPCWPLP